MFKFSLYLDSGVSFQLVSVPFLHVPILLWVPAYIQEGKIPGSTCILLVSSPVMVKELRSQGTDSFLEDNGT